MTLTRILCGCGSLLLAACQAESPQVNTQPPPGAQFAASEVGTVYYPLACDAWRSIAPANLRWFQTEREAAVSGYKATTNRSCRAFFAPSSNHPLTDSCTVIRIIDGDTLDCHEGGERIRLLLIDAPELNQGTVGALARDALAELAPVGSELRVESDLDRSDRYQRLLAYLYTADGRMVNEEMARLGFAVVSVYPPNIQHVDRIRAAAAEASAAGRGLWSGSAFDCHPADHREGRC